MKEFYVLHPEEEPNIDEINSNTDIIKEKILDIDKKLIESGNRYDSFLRNLKLKIKDIHSKLDIEKERLEDINILCNKYTDFCSVIPLNNTNLYGNLTMDKNIISAFVKSYKNVPYEILSIEGNGYEGNEHVYLNKMFLNEKIDSSNRSAIKDNNIATYYEYSRITTDNSTNSLPTLFNKDSNECECIFELKTEDLMNKIILYSDRKDFILKAVYTSLDGFNYILDKEYNIAINNKDEQYYNGNYIYNSGIITFNSTNYIKLYFKSNGYTNDTLAYKKTISSDVINKDDIIKKIEKVPTAKRHVIKINDLKALQNEYKQGFLISKELITSPVKNIAINCNEYINSKYMIENNITYILIINGIEHEIIPINCHRNGVKIIKFSSKKINNEHICYLNESIKSAKLKIMINNTSKDMSPYISDIKVLIGGK